MQNRYTFCMHLRYALIKQGSDFCPFFWCTLTLRLGVSSANELLRYAITMTSLHTRLQDVTIAKHLVTNVAHKHLDWEFLQLTNYYGTPSSRHIFTRAFRMIPWLNASLQMWHTNILIGSFFSNMDYGSWYNITMIFLHMRL